MTAEEIKIISLNLYPMVEDMYGDDENKDKRQAFVFGFEKGFDKGNSDKIAFAKIKCAEQVKAIIEKFEANEFDKIFIEQTYPLDQIK